MKGNEGSTLGGVLSGDNGSSVNLPQNQLINQKLQAMALQLQQ